MKKIGSHIALIGIGSLAGISAHALSHSKSKKVYFVLAGVAVAYTVAIIADMNWWNSKFTSNE